jgi:hypothetical protein
MLSGWELASAMFRDCFSGSRGDVVGRRAVLFGASIFSPLAGCILVASNQKCGQESLGSRVVNGGEKVGGTFDEATQLRGRMNERLWQSQMHAGVGKRWMRRRAIGRGREGKKRSANAGWPLAHVRVAGLRLPLPVVDPGVV